MMDFKRLKVTKSKRNAVHTKNLLFMFTKIWMCSFSTSIITNNETCVCSVFDGYVLRNKALHVLLSLLVC